MTPPADALIVIEGDEVAGEVSPRYLSVAIDAAQVIGGPFWDPSGETEGGSGNTRVDPYDFANPKIRTLAAGLAPGFLRIGGSEADRIYYDLGEDPGEAPEPYLEVMTRSQWDGVNAFAVALDYRVLFTLNVGVGPRDAERRWTPDNARELIEYTRSMDYPVDVWELGNEINAFPALHGVENQLTALEYVEDVTAARALIDEVDPESKLAGPSSAFWPRVGELNPIYPEFMEAGGGAMLDVITWHYYPQQSSRCPVASRRAEEETLFSPKNLDEIDTWADLVEDARDEHAPGVEVWLGETGHAQCGGQPGVSETFASSFWWLDQLARMALRSQPIMIRQTLSGSNYGLLDDLTLDPRPDYWASYFWKRFMGTRALAVETSAAGSQDGDGVDKLRVYAHCGPEDVGVTVLVINLDLEQPVRVGVPALDAGTIELYAVTAADFLAKNVMLNGTTLELTQDEALPSLEPVVLSAAQASSLQLAPASYAFIVLRDADVGACQ